MINKKRKLKIKMYTDPHQKKLLKNKEKRMKK